MSLDRAAFFAAAPAVPSEVVAVPAFGGTVNVVGMTAGERDRFEAQTPRKGRPSNVRARLIIACVRDDEGRPVFTADDLDAVAALPAPAVEPIVEAALRVCGISKADTEALEKN